MRAPLFIASLLAVCFSSSISAFGAEIPKELQDVGIEEKLGNSVSIQSLKFRDESGAEVPLSKYFGKGKPVLLTLVYFECPNLCNYLLNGLVDSLKPLQWSAGNEFDMISLSIEPKETPDLAKAKKEAYIASMGRPGAEQGWHFLTGSEAQIRQIANEVGFKYKWDAIGKQYAHTAGVFVLTPEGKISRVLHGVLFKERDLRLSLVEASKGKIGTILDRVILFCFHYDPATRSYTPYVFRIMQAGAIGTVLVLGGYLAWFWRRQRKGALTPC